MSDSVLLNLLYIRHGESYGNLSAQPSTAVFDPENPPLSERGRVQAELLGERLSKGRLDAIYSSPLERAVQTAYEAAKRQNDMPIILLPDIMEAGTAPDYKGCSQKLLASEYPLAVPCITEPSPAGGMLTLGEESEQQRAGRARRVVKFFRHKYTGGETVAVFSHGTFFRYFICAALNIPVSDKLRFSSFNSGVTKFKFYDGGSVKLSYSNDTSHLYSVRNDLTYTI